MTRRLTLLLALAALAPACKRDEGPRQPLMAAPAAPAAPAMPPPAAPAAPASPAGTPPAPAAPAPAAPPPMAPPAAVSPELLQRITATQLVVSQDPKNVRAWIQLGNDYFDSQQRQKAIDAYARALELQPDNPDVLTDQGVMYRELGAFDRAILNFQQANKVAPTHVQSLFNLGVVYAYDLRLPDNANAAWRKVIEIAPGSPQAAQARQAIADLARR